MKKHAYSIKEAGFRAGIGSTKIYSLINSGKLKARKLGRRTIILDDDLEAFLSSLETIPVKNQEA
ncbi:MAG: helix-turn-helix domain-containing protein [Alphaproteobacteria bacterium]|nr:helix-turn-helix domain-containing protein [Alphaproteobacteria bacterium]